QFELQRPEYAPDMRAGAKALQHRQVEEPVSTLDKRHRDKASAMPAVAIGKGDTQPVGREKAEETPQPEAGIGAALFETGRNDEAADDQEEDNARPAQVAVAQGRKGGQTSVQAMFYQNEQCRQATGNIEEIDPLPGRGGTTHEASPGRHEPC